MIDVVAWISIGLVAAQIVVHRALISALWFRHEDPRPMALLRIATGGLVLVWLVDLAPLYDYLLTSDGVLDGAQARHEWGREGPLSLLYTHDDPAFVRGYVIVLGAAATALTLGLATPVTKWLTWASFVGLVGRGGLSAGGEQIFACMLFYLCLSRCGHALGIDAWLHRRRHASGGYRPIPAWPRNLAILQMIAVFCANGLAKHGPMWRQGDVVHYVFNHPDFRPADLLELSQWLGPTPFRVMTWITHTFELSFFLVVVGLVVRFVRDHPGLMPRGRRRWIGRAVGLAIGVDVIVLASLRLTGPARDSMPFVFSIALGLVIALGPLVVALAARLPAVVLAWLLGRRLWVSLWLLFTAQLAFVLQIGWFTALTMCAAVIMFDGEEIGRLAARVRPRPAGRPSAPVDTRPAVDPIGPWRRHAIAALSAFHVVAVMAAVLPTDRPVSRWRHTLERPLHRWIRQTTFNQHWRMFAPSGPTAAIDIEVVLRGADDQTLAVGPGLVPLERLRSTWGLDKREKVRRRLGNRRSGERFWPWHARWVCRRFGDAIPGPVVAELYTVHAPIPSPRALERRGASEARARAASDTARELVFSEACLPSRQARGSAPADPPSP